MRNLVFLMWLRLFTVLFPLVWDEESLQAYNEYSLRQWWYR